ncbi:Uncharacterised protein [Chlamydia trachomatis]|nr:Uncharacterised protein [Chlamydia trachomatis]CRH46636.1 Uncharacterised protein [Chlamydia trachomatis]CRH54871.1 Uncharacterised protein [Chlamydia trachomatis]CRH55721.1 Uncharacterised protein [Chlamydia trachomatis]
MSKIMDSAIEEILAIKKEAKTKGAQNATRPQ